MPRNCRVTIISTAEQKPSSAAFQSMMSVVWKQEALRDKYSGRAICWIDDLDLWLAIEEEESLLLVAEAGIEDSLDTSNRPHLRNLAFS